MIKEKLIQLELENKLFIEVKGVIKLLHTRFKEPVRCLDIVAENSRPRNVKDKFIMKATFRMEESGQELDIYYGDESRIVTKVEWR